MTRVATRGRRFNHVRRSTFWTGIASSTLTNIIVAAPSDAQSVVTQAEMENVPNPTLVRTRGEIGVYGDMTADDAAILVGFGLMVADTKAFTIGTTALPLPLTDPDSDDWFWYTTRMLINAPTGITDQLSAASIAVDSKAMRKIGGDETVVLVAEIDDHGSGIGVNFGFALRFLFKK